MSSTTPVLAAPVSAPSGLTVWLLAIRPKTLTAALAPVAVGTGLAFGHRKGHWDVALAALFGAVFIQIGTNLLNDYYDFFKGADTHERLGPLRVTQSGLLSPKAVLAGGVAAFGLAVVTGLYLASVGGWPILVVGALSLLSGYLYTGGPYPLGYHGLGDLFVFLFFGFAAVVGTYYVQALALSPVAWLAAVPIGGLGTAILVANNLRDRLTDAKASKRTLVVRFGERAGRAEYVLLLVVAYLSPLIVWLGFGSRPWVLLPLLSVPLAAAPLRRVLTQSGRGVAPALAETAKLEGLFGILWAVGLWLNH